MIWIHNFNTMPSKLLIIDIMLNGSPMQLAKNKKKPMNLSLVQSSVVKT
jgi:hypothetical protein